MRKIITFAACLFLSATSASAQGTVANPLHKEAVEKKTTVVAAAPAELAAADKPKRERSAKQKQSDEDMRSCGTSWRGDKDALKAKGETWRSYLKTCRAQLKTSRGV